VSASRHVQDLDPVTLPRPHAAGAHVPTVVDVDALRVARFPVARPRAVLRVAIETLPEREPTFDELVHGWGERSAAADGDTRRAEPGWFRPRRAARAKAAR
jgi:hypothetical protein